MQTPLTNGRTGFASACRDIPADWRCWTGTERRAALAMLTMLAAIPAALFGGIPPGWASAPRPVWNYGMRAVDPT